MDWTWLSGNYAVFQGHKFRLRSHDKDRLQLATESSALASRLGFSSGTDGVFVKWVPRADVTELVRELWWGNLDGQVVWIQAEVDDKYSIEVEGGPLARKWGLTQIDRGEWRGLVPKKSFSRVWREPQPLRL